jgi:hypothetical protein
LLLVGIKADGAKVHTNFKELIVQLKENGKDDDILLLVAVNYIKHLNTLVLYTLQSPFLVIEGDVKLNGLDFNDWI